MSIKNNILVIFSSFLLMLSFTVFSQDIYVKTNQNKSFTDDANTNIDFDIFANPAQITTVEIDGDANADAVVLTDTQASTFTINNDSLFSNREK